ncbi:YdcF family protein [Allofrancisella inopinata]|uniref:YdcF family protein n=1 Tax=Allofrancisella inopinata TaxID=1085647 RepID=A0AAE6YKW8_9GAMM|nr:YdcF family protein [Allofrancisella inopinata]QIV96819.1 YdcF family protein [Allofrancisella inopinata]
MSDLLDLGCIFFFVLIISCIFTRKYVRIFFIFIVIVYYLTGSGLLGKLLASSLETKLTDINMCSNTKGIILLGAGVLKPLNGNLEPSLAAYDRILKTAEVYTKYPQTIIITGGITNDNKLSEAEVYADDLYNLGVPKPELLLEKQAKNTYQNAKFVKEIIGNSQNNYCLITGSTHLKRAKIYFNQFDIKTISLASSNPTTQLKILPNAYNFYITQRIIHEYMGIIKGYMMRN